MNTLSLWGGFGVLVISSSYVIGGNMPPAGPPKAI